MNSRQINFANGELMLKPYYAELAKITGVSEVTIRQDSEYPEKYQSYFTPCARFRCSLESDDGIYSSHDDELRQNAPTGGFAASLVSPWESVLLKWQQQCAPVGPDAGGTKDVTDHHRVSSYIAHLLKRNPLAKSLVSSVESIRKSESMVGR